MMLNRRMFAKGAALGGLSLMAGPLAGQHVFKEVNALHPGEFTWHPERSPYGPVSVVVSIDEQRVHVYRGGIRIAVSTCSTGKPGHETPTGVFVVLQKDRDHHSSTYNNAPMPNMNRLTWGGIALHAGNLPGYPASHGCIRLPLDFSARLFEVTHLGTPVIIGRSGSAPQSVVHPGLILGAYSEDEFERILSTLELRKHPSDWNLDETHPITSMIASSHDERILLIENDREVAEGPLIWDGRPLGPHVYVLNGPDDGTRGMRWQALTYDDAARAEHDLTRVRSDDAFSNLISERSHPGMIFVFTDLPLHPDRRSGRDFVIMS
ncbi:MULTISPECIES: L,D-transpeptidase [Roseobacteraceae]|uniref:L,D-transpeptidase n=1 Tax=Roseobacteraceae TaxID=2854170 RepID=UPI0031DD7869